MHSTYVLKDILTYSEVRVIQRGRRKERDRERMCHLLIHFLDGHNGQCWVRLKAAAKSIIWSPMWVAELKHLDHILLFIYLFFKPSAVSYIVSRAAAGIKTSAHMECQCCREWLYLQKARRSAHDWLMMFSIYNNLTGMQLHYKSRSICICASAGVGLSLEHLSVTNYRTNESMSTLCKLILCPDRLALDSLGINPQCFTGEVASKHLEGSRANRVSPSLILCFMTSCSRRSLIYRYIQRDTQWSHVYDEKTINVTIISNT